MTRERREALKIALGVAISFVLILGILVISVYGNALDDYEITSGADMSLTIPTSLRAGEIWTGKSAVHNLGGDGKPDGTITVTLLAWGTSFIDENGETQKPLGGNGLSECVTIRDDLGEFRVVGSLPAELMQSGNSIIWEAHQDLLLAQDSPVTVSYTLELSNMEALKTRYWYATGTAVANFIPSEGNPVYWTKEESVENAFTMSMNWNNGKGLNSGTITDSIIGVTLSFGKNSSPEFEYAYGRIPLPDPLPYPGYRIETFCGEHGSSHWDTNVIASGHPEINRWHLEWNKTNDVKNYYFTVGGLGALQLQTGGAAIDIVYEVIFPNPGGNYSQPGRRTLKSDDFFHRTFDKDRPADRFSWNGQEIVVPINVFGEMKLDLGAWVTGSLTIKKALSGFYEIDWDVNADTMFTAMVKDQDGNYLTFQPEGAGRYTYTGVTSSAANGSRLTFSKNSPATIDGIPEGTECTVQEVFAAKSDLITVDISPNHAVEIVHEENTEVIVTNTYAHGLGKIEIWKIYDGFPSDWGVDNSTTFYAEVWDVDYENYLLFKAVPEADGSYRCVGNTKMGLSESYLGEVVTKLPFGVGRPITLSNLWTWGKYEVREVGAETLGHMSDYTDPMDYWKDYHWQVEYSANNGTHELLFDETMVVTVTNRYKHGVGSIAIYKTLDGYPEDWGVTDDTVFYARVADIGDDRSLNYLWFKTEPEPDGRYWCVGNNIAGFTEGYVGDYMEYIPFSVNKPIVLANLWAEDSEYHIEEVNPPGVNVPGSYDSVVDYSSNDFVVPIDDIQSVNVTNTYARGYTPPDDDEDDTHGVGNLVIRKELDAGAFHADFGVDASTVFYIKVFDEAHGNYLIFKPNPELADGSYRCIGHLECDDDACGNTDVGGVHYSETPGAPYITEVPFSVNSPAVLSNLWTVGHYYTVEEIERIELEYSGYYTITYSPAGGTVGNNEVLYLTVINTFRHGSGDLEINKVLDGSPEALETYDVDESTVFLARVFDVTAGNYLLFRATPEPDGSYRCVGNEVNGLSEPYDGEAISVIPFSSAANVVLTNLWPGREYRVEEVDEDDVPVDESIASYSVSSRQLLHERRLNVTVTNSYSDGGADPIIDDDPDPSSSPSPSPDPDPDPSSEPEEPDGGYGGGGDDDDDDDDGDGDGDGSGGGGGGSGNGGGGSGNGGGGSGNGGGGSGNGGGGNNSDGDDSNSNNDGNNTNDNSNDRSNENGFDGSDNDGEPTYNTTLNVEQTTPGGRDHDIPPVMNDPVNHTITMDTDGNYIEIDEQGMPLGIWHWDDDAEEWIYDEFPPLGEIPQTGVNEGISFPLLVCGLFLIGTGRLIKPRRKSEEDA